MRNLSISIFIIFGSCILCSQPSAKYNMVNNYINEGKVDYLSLSEKEIIVFAALKEQIEFIPKNEIENIAQYINIYNLIVIKSVIQNYPIQSVNEVGGFFKEMHQIGLKSYSLDQIEEQIFKLKNDPRIHLALICGAKDCPPYPMEAFLGSKLEDQLHDQTKYALSKPNILFISEDSEVILASKIFQWYSSDFGEIESFISNHTDIKLPAYRIKYSQYDWRLNDSKAYTKNNIQPTVTINEDARYFASNLYADGEYEINFFNNYYTQTQPQNGFVQRENFFTTFIQPLWGWRGVNIGIDLKLRSVSTGPTNNHGTFDALKFKNTDIISSEFGELPQSNRFGITQIGPRIKYQPFGNISGLTFQHSIHIPVLLNGEGNGNKSYIDWGSPSLYNDAFYDQSLTQKTSLFLQVGAYIENINGATIGISDGYWQFSTPVTTILNYFPSQKSTIYFLLNAAPQFGYSVNDGNFDPSPNHYNQYGIGFKYFLTERIQAEVLATKFSSSIPDRKAATYNFGIRYFGW